MHFLDNDGTFRVTFLPQVKVTLADARETIDAVDELLRGEKVPGLVDARPTESMTDEARVYFLGPEVARVATAVALLVNSPVSRVIGNVFLGMHQVAFPIKIYNTEAQALGWLAQFLNRED